MDTYVDKCVDIVQGAVGGGGGDVVGRGDGEGEGLQTN